MALNVTPVEYCRTLSYFVVGVDLTDERHFGRENEIADLRELPFMCCEYVGISPRAFVINIFRAPSLP